ncbi:MFS transporter [Rickettsiales bacterium]|nr:MFS transporter [Rickettsiales bacterium]
MKKLSLSKLIYCSPAFSFAIPTFPVMILLPQIYVTDYNLAFATIGSVLFLAKIIDMFSDPLMGWVCDKNFLSKKSWIVIGTFISGIAFYKLILPDVIPDAIYLFVWISLLYFGYTVFQVSYLSIGYDLEIDYEKRSKLSAGREFFVILGLLSSVSLPVLFKDITIASELFLLYLALFSGSITIPMFLMFIRETKGETSKDLKFNNLLVELRENESLFKLLIPWFLNCLANAFPMLLFVFFVTSILNGTEEEKELILFLYFLSALLGMAFWVLLIKYIEKKDIWRLSMTISSLVFVFVFFLETGNIIYFLIISCLTGFCLGADLAIPPSMLSDVTDYHKKKFKSDISGLLFSMLILINKLTFALATLVAFSILDYFDYNAEKTSSENAKYILVFMYAGVPITLKLIIVNNLKKFSLSKKEMAKIRENLYG